MQGVASLVGAPTARVAEARKQLADPETTWRTFVAALRAADLPAVRRCLTPEMRQKAERVFSQMSAAELRAMADSFTDFKVTGKRETYGTAVVTAKGRGGLIHFINAGGEWRIAEMSRRRRRDGGKNVQLNLSPCTRTRPSGTVRRPESLFVYAQIQLRW